MWLTSQIQRCARGKALGCGDDRVVRCVQEPGFDADAANAARGGAVHRAAAAPPAALRLAPRELDADQAAYFSEGSGDGDDESAEESNTGAAEASTGGNDDGATAPHIAVEFTNASRLGGRSVMHGERRETGPPSAFAVRLPC